MTPKTRFKRGEDPDPDHEFLHRRSSLTPTPTKAAPGEPAEADAYQERRKSLRKVGLDLKDASPV